MSRTLVAISLVLVLASVSYGDWLVQSWEDGGSDISSWGPAITGGQTTGVTDGQLSCKVVGATGWGFIGMVQGFPDAYGNSVNAAAFEANTKVSVDVTLLAEDYSDNTFNMGIAVNSGITGWKQGDDLMPIWWSPDMGDMTFTVTFDYSAYKTGTGNTWAQIILYQNSQVTDNSLPNYVLYLDNVRLTPEPATMGLLGLGALALIRRKK